MKNVVLWNISEGVSIIQKSTCHAVFGKQMLFSWATRIRTLKMTESESVALPFGDSPSIQRYILYSSYRVTSSIFFIFAGFFEAFSWSGCILTAL